MKRSILEILLLWRKKRNARISQRLKAAMVDLQWEKVSSILIKIIDNQSLPLPEDLLFIAIENNAPEAIIWLLLQIDPGTFVSYMEKESRQCPVHLLAKNSSSSCQGSYSLDLFCAVISLHSSLLTWSDKNGSTPLHIYLIKNKVNYDTVAFICNLKPSVALMEDGDGNTPMEIAILADNPPIAPEVLDLLHTTTSESQKYRYAQSERYRLTKRKVSYSGSSFSNTSQTLNTSEHEVQGGN